MLLMLILIIVFGTISSLPTPVKQPQESLVRNVHLKLGTDDNWSLVYDKKTAAPVRERIRIEIECPMEAMLKNIGKTQHYLVNWFKDDKKISKYNGHLHVNDLFLTIRSADHFDSGDYFCEIITGAGINLKSPKLSLQLTNSPRSFTDSSSLEDDLVENEVEEKVVRDGFEPIFVNEFETSSIYYRIESSAIELDCRAHGDPTPQVLWYKDGSIISEEDLGPTRNSMSLSLDNSILTDSGRYQCIVSNKFGQLNRTFDIEVIEKEIVKQTIVSGETVLLECPLLKNPLQIQLVKWYKRVENGANDQSSISVNTDVYVELSPLPLNYPPANSFLKSNLADLMSNVNLRSKLSQLNDGSMLIRGVDQNDSGLYLCSSATSRKLSKRVEIEVTVDEINSRRVQPSSSSQLIRPLIVLFVVLALLVLLLVVFLKLVCYRRNSPVKVSSNVVNQQQLNKLPVTRLTSSPKDYEYYSNRWYSENRPTNVSNYVNTNYNTNYMNTPMVPPDYVNGDSMGSGGPIINYFDTTERRAHLALFNAQYQHHQYPSQPQLLPQQPSRLYLSTRSTGSYSRAPSHLSVSKSCSRMSTR